jgi:hypothetical protein
VVSAATELEHRAKDCVSAGEPIDTSWAEALHEHWSTARGAIEAQIAVARPIT